MRRVQAGDAAALGILFERYSRLVLNGAMRILRDRAEAQDLLQNVFLYILRRGCMFDPARGTVASWVLQLTYSRSLNRRNGYLTRLSLRAVPVHVATDLADPETGADGATEKLSARKVVRLALAELTEAQRETLHLYFFEGYSLLVRSAENVTRAWATRATISIGVWSLSDLYWPTFRSALMRAARSRSSSTDTSTTAPSRQT